MSRACVVGRQRERAVAPEAVRQVFGDGAGDSPRPHGVRVGGAQQGGDLGSGLMSMVRVDWSVRPSSTDRTCMMRDGRSCGGASSPSSSSRSSVTLAADELLPDAAQSSYQAERPPPMQTPGVVAKEDSPRSDTLPRSQAMPSRGGTRTGLARQRRGGSRPA